MDNTNHLDECLWKLKGIQKTKTWYTFMNIKHCPICQVEIEVTDEA